MTNYHLAKLILMAEGLESRKRIQKTVHLLQAAGCPLELDDFRLHHYGPYSAELAELLDRMATTKMLVESTSQTVVGRQYDYQFNDRMLDSLEAFERTPEGAAAKSEMERYDELLHTLLAEKPRVLELASTMVEFAQSGKAWDSAQEMTADFKGEGGDSPAIREARKLAESVIGRRNGKHR